MLSHIGTKGLQKVFTHNGKEREDMFWLRAPIFSQLESRIILSA